MTTEPGFDRRAVVVYPARAIETALAALRRWTEDRGIELVQLGTGCGLIFATGLGSYVGGVVVGRLDPRGVLDEVDADQ